jgi:hypothetical protein
MISFLLAVFAILGILFASLLLLLLPAIAVAVLLRVFTPRPPRSRLTERGRKARTMPAEWPTRIMG